MAKIIDTGRANTVVVEAQRTVAAVREVSRPVKVSSPGPAGPRGQDGAPGANGAGYTHEQFVASTTWTIAHNLGFRPAVELYDEGGQEFSADIGHLNENTVIVTTVTPVAGFARLN
ncbi:hypothetical protein [Pseudoxanthomonas mexicana]|jgi:hypothetical protein